MALYKCILSLSLVLRLGGKCSVQVCRYTPSSRCRPSSCLLADFRQYFAVSEWNVSATCSAILFLLPKQFSLVPRFSGLTVHCDILGALLHVIGSIWWIMRVLLASQKWMNIKKNYAEREECYPPRPITPPSLTDCSLYCLKVQFNKCFENT